MKPRIVYTTAFEKPVQSVVRERLSADPGGRMATAPAAPHRAVVVFAHSGARRRLPAAASAPALTCSGCGAADVGRCARRAKPHLVRRINPRVPGDGPVAFAKGGCVRVAPGRPQVAQAHRRTTDANKGRVPADTGKPGKRRQGGRSLTHSGRHAVRGPRHGQQCPRARPRVAHRRPAARDGIGARPPSAAAAGERHRHSLIVWVKNLSQGRQRQRRRRRWWRQRRRRWWPQPWWRLPQSDSQCPDRLNSVPPLNFKSVEDPSLPRSSHGGPT